MPPRKSPRKKKPVQEADGIEDAAKTAKGKKKGRPSAKKTAPPKKKPKTAEPIMTSSEEDIEDIDNEEEVRAEEEGAASSEEEQAEQGEQADAPLIVLPPKNANKANKAISKKILAPRQFYKILDQKLEEDLLKWMQAEENDFLWNTMRTDYRSPQKKKTRFAEKEKLIREDPEIDMEMTGKY